MRPALAFLLLLASGACGPRVDRLTMEPLIIRVDPSGGESTVETPDPLLDELATLQEEGRCDEAIPRLEKFLEEFPESLRFGEAVVRLGQCHETRKEWERARGYHRWAAQNGHFDLAYEAALRAAWCLEEMGEPALAAKEYGVLAGIGRAPDEARAGARLRQAINLFRAGEAKRARKALDRGIVAFSALRDPGRGVRSAAAEARFAAAEERARAFSGVRLEYPQRRLDKRVAQKAAALADAQTAFEAVTQIRDAEWAAAAVCRIGELKEEMHRALLEVPPPPELDDAQRREYEAKVAARLQPLQQAAFQAYLQVVALGERIGLDSPWVTKSRERMQALEAQLKRNVISPDDPEEDDRDAPGPEPAPE